MTKEIKVVREMMDTSKGLGRRKPCETRESSHDS